MTPISTPTSCISNDLLRLLSPLLLCSNLALFSLAPNRTARFWKRQALTAPLFLIRHDHHNDDRRSILSLDVSPRPTESYIPGPPQHVYTSTGSAKVNISIQCSGLLRRPHQISFGSQRHTPSHWYSRSHTENRLRFLGHWSTQTHSEKREG